VSEETCASCIYCVVLDEGHGPQRWCDARGKFLSEESPTCPLYVNYNDMCDFMDLHPELD